MRKEKDTNGEKNREKQNANLIKFTPLNARQAQEASVRARNIRKQVRAQMLETLVNNMDFGAEMLKAMKKCDLDKINLLQTAMKIVGLTHDQSEDAINKLQIDAKTDNTTAVSGKIEFVLPTADK